MFVFFHYGTMGGKQRAPSSPEEEALPKERGKVPKDVCSIEFPKKQRQWTQEVSRRVLTDKGVRAGVSLVLRLSH